MIKLYKYFTNLASGLPALKIFVLLIPFFVIAVSYILYHKSPFQLVYPNNDKVKESVTLQLFDDRYEQGKSQVSVLEEHGNKLSYKYRISNATLNPYAGVEYVPSKGDILDLSGYDYLKVKIKASKGKHITLSIGVQIEEEDPGKRKSAGTRDDSDKAFRLMSTVLNTDTIFRELVIPMQELTTPDWWFIAGNHKKEEIGAPDFSKVIFIYFGNCVAIPPDVDDIVELEEITFYKDYTTFYTAFVLGLILYLLVVALIYSRRTKTIEVNFYHGELKSDIPLNQEEKIVFSYITSHYPQKELSLADLLKATGYTEKKISEIIKGKTGMNFKQFLNRLRIAEAKRLLSETDFNISEIAEKVGYGHISHFNRVFKTTEGIAPNEYKKTLSTIQDEI